MNLESGNKLKTIYEEYFSLKYMGEDCSNKLAFLSLTCHLTNILKEKKPEITCWSVLYKLNKSSGEPIPEKNLFGLSIICEDLMYGTNNFPTFGLKDKEIPDKLKELMKNWLPF